MDAAEADADVKLYKASGELLLELQAKIPRLVKSPNGGNKFRKWIIDSKVDEVTKLLDSFQEWPQLLDPHLASLVQELVDAYLSYCVEHSSDYLKQHNVSVEVSPLPRAIARILYAFCKVRGRKIIVRLLNNEPKYVEPLLSCFRLWTQGQEISQQRRPSTMTWKERYIHLLWLSHLMLAPFELSTISVLSIDFQLRQRFPALYTNLPEVSTNLAVAALDHLDVASKTREGASALLVRLSLRSDMQKLGLTERLVAWAIDELRLPTEDGQLSDYRCIGLLELLFGIVNSASNSEAAPFLSKVFQIVHTAATSSDKHFQTIRDSAPARKLLVKIMRSAVVHAISVNENQILHGVEVDLNAMLEDSIQVMLDFLADKDTPVRQAASKALSQVCLKLNADMSSEVVEAVVDNLNENMLLEDTANGRLFPITDITKSASTNYSKNTDAVDPLRWHGCMLTLGHLLFRRSLPPSLLSEVIEVLLMGLNFEQRSNVGTSVGVGVRDAACFGIWSLARKYSTDEVNQALLSAASLSTFAGFSGATNTTTLQSIATQLAVSACLDPSGNLRRGSSAALQELIGRHPDAIVEGIAVVQTIDYHGVARRSRAITEVAITASKLSGCYHAALMYALLGWRGARSTDADSRRQAAEAVRTLVTMATENDVLRYLRELVLQTRRLKLSNKGSNASARHGLLCSLANAIESLVQHADSASRTSCFVTIRPLFQDFSTAIGDIGGRVTIDVENVLEATSKLILAFVHLASSLEQQKRISDDNSGSPEWAVSFLPVLQRCTFATEKEYVTNAVAHANVAVMAQLDRNSREALLLSWLDPKGQTKADFTCKGRTSTIGKSIEVIHSGPGSESLQTRLIQYLGEIVHSAQKIEVKVNAMQSISNVLSARTKARPEDLQVFVTAIHCGLMDYTIDQRGDIGSLLRLEAIEAARHLVAYDMGMDNKTRTLQLLARLAAEKLVKARFKAWEVLEASLVIDRATNRIFDNQVDVSSFAYFRNLLNLLQQPRFREELLIGLISSVAGGTEEVSRACSEALIAFIHDQNASEQGSVIRAILDCVTRYMNRVAKSDDREVIPAIDFLALLVEHILPRQQGGSSVLVDDDLIWTTCQNVLSASPTLLRVEAMTRLYSALVSLDQFRTRALDKLTRLLLHRWPKVRGTAADAIFLNTASQSLVSCDWNAPVADNKSTVLALRKELNVAGVAVTGSLPKLAVAA